MLKKFFKSALNGIVFWVLAASIFGFFSKYCFITDICSHFRIQYLIFGVAALIVYYLLRTKDKIVYSFVFLIIFINFFEITACSNVFKINIQKDINDNFKSKIKISTINILTTNTKYEQVCRQITENDADILVVEEIDKRWCDELGSVKKKYPYKYEYLRDDNFGMAIYSKIPVKKFDIINAGTIKELPVVSALVEKDGKNIEIIGLHTTPPARKDYFENTCKVFEDLASYIQKRNNPIVLTGDMNSSRFSYNYKNFIKVSKMNDAGQMFQFTWPSFWLLPFRIQLDHVFYTNDIQITSFKVGDYIGSDHFPVYVELLF